MPPTFLPAGWDEAGLKAAVDARQDQDPERTRGGSGEWPKDYGTYTKAWDTTTATNNMEAIIDKAVADGTTIDAVLAENDSTALGVAAPSRPRTTTRTRPSAARTATPPT